MLAVAVTLAGTSFPAVTTAVRRTLPLRIPHPEGRAAGYALLSVSFQVALAIGPVLVSGAILLRDADLAITLSAGLIAVATATFAVAKPEDPPSRHLRKVRPVPVGSWISPGLLALYLVAGLTGAAIGVTTVAIPAITTGAALSAMTGLVFSATAIGDVVGALIYGSRRWPLTAPQQLRTALIAGFVAAGILFLASSNPWLLLPAAFFGGLVAAPASIRMSALLDELVPATSLGVAYSVLVSVGLVASAAGGSVAGLASTSVNPHHLLLGPPILLLSSVAATWPVARDPRRRVPDDA